MMKRLTFVCILVVGAGAIRMPSLLRRTARHASFVAPPPSLLTPDYEVTPPETTAGNLVCFVGETTMRSEPVQIPANAQFLDDFFAQDEHRNIIFSDQANVRIVTAGGDNELLEIDTTMGLAGLRVCSTTVIAAQLHKSISDDPPAYTFELVDSRLSATGAAPLVWLFDKLISNKQTECGENTISSKSTTRVSCEQTSGGDLVFTTAARIQVSIRVPECLVKFVTTRGIEEQGCQAMQVFLENEVGPALSRFRNAYLIEQDLLS